MSIAHTYCAASPNSWRDRLTFRARRKLYREMERMIPLGDMQSVLDVGVTADRNCGFSNFFEAMFPHPESITALSDQDAAWMSEAWPGLKFVCGDARRMPSKDESFDFLFSSAVIEHVGSRDCQRTFLSECVRVARKRVFTTTPKRWFPVEMHTGFPLLYWLPVRWHRTIIRSLDLLSKEENLNLLDEGAVRKLDKDIGVESPKIRKMLVFSFLSNMLILIEKGDPR